MTLAMEHERASVEKMAEALLQAQPIRDGTPLMASAGEYGPVPAEHVAAVLHALAQFQHTQHIVDVVVDQRALAPGGESDPRGDWRPRETSLGRYFHALADTIEMETSP